MNSGECTATAEELVEAALAEQGAAYSTAYRDGMLAVVRWRLCEVEKTRLPYAPDSREAEEYFAGAAAGHLLASAVRAVGRVDVPEVAHG